MQHEPRDGSGDGSGGGPGAVAADSVDDHVDHHAEDRGPVADADPLAALRRREHARDLERREQQARVLTQQRKEGRGRGTALSMVWSLLAVLAIVVALLALVPRVNGVTQPPVDVASAAPEAAQRLGFQPAVPQGLPADWSATSVRTTVATAGVLTWHAGYTFDALYAAVEQGRNAPQDWLRAQTNRGQADGTQVVDGVTWNRVLRVDKVQNSLVHERADGVTTVVTGTASYQQLGLLAAALQPAG